MKALGPLAPSIRMLARRDLAVQSDSDRSHTMLPDYIIYDELERERDERDDQGERPRVEIPQRPPPEFDEPEREEQQEDEEDSDRGVTIISI